MFYSAAFAVVAELILNKNDSVFCDNVKVLGFDAKLIQSKKWVLFKEQLFAPDAVCRSCFNERDVAWCGAPKKYCYNAAHCFHISSVEQRCAPTLTSQELRPKGGFQELASNALPSGTFTPRDRTGWALRRSCGAGKKSWKSKGCAWLPALKFVVVVDANAEYQLTRL